MWSYPITDLATDPQGLFILLGTYIKDFASGGFVSADLYVQYCTITSKKQGKENNKRETIDHHSHLAAASGHAP